MPSRAEKDSKEGHKVKALYIEVPEQEAWHREHPFYEKGSPDFADRGITRKSAGY